MRASLVVVLLVAAVYASAVPNGFVYDDWDLIVNNTWLKHGPFLDLFRLGYWESSRGGSFYYRPAVSLTYWIDHRIWGERPFGYHLSNLLFHVAACLLLLALARRWMTSLGAALAVAALFAVHPLHTQSVAWIAGRTDLVAAVFFLAALLLQQHAIERSSRAGIAGEADAFGEAIRGRSAANDRLGGAALQAASLCAFAVALLAKEMAVTYPAVLALHAMMMSRARRPGDGDRLAMPDRRWWPGIAMSLAMLAAWFGLRLVVVGHAAGYADDPHAWWRVADGTASRLLAVPSIICFYAKRLLIPVTLGFESGIQPLRAAALTGPAGLADLAGSVAGSHSGSLAGPLIVPLAALLALAAVAVVLRRRDAALTLGAVWFLLTLLPVANLFPIFESAMEHFAYLPSAGFIVAGVALGGILVKGARLRIAVVMALVLLFGWRTALRNFDWKDEGTFWAVTTRETPSARAWNNLGLFFKGEGRLNEAAEALTHVADYEPGLPATWSNLGVVAAKRSERLSAGGDAGAALEARKEAIALFNRALALDPGEADSLYNLALVLETGDRGGAEAAYRRLLAVRPNHAEGWTNLGVLLEQDRRPDEAATAYERAIDAAPDLPEPQAFLAAILWRRGERARASDLYRRYLQLAPSGDYAGEARSRLER